MHAFTTIPFLRICIPFIGGILCTVLFGVGNPPFFFLLILLIAGVYFAFLKLNNRFSKLVFLCSADLFLFCSAIQLTNSHDLRNNPLHYSRVQNADSVQSFIGYLTDVPVNKEKTLKCEVSLSHVLVNKQFEVCNGKLLVYVLKQSTLLNIPPGSRLLVQARLREIPEPMNPEGFNYRTFLLSRQIYHTALVQVKDIQLLNAERSFQPISDWALTCKYKIIEGLRHSGLSKQASEICAALLTGYDDEIDQDVIQAFAHSGTLHVLSVSGLHTGLIYLVLTFLFNRIDKHNRYKLTRLLVLTLLLWAFALLTGFSAPVLRAVLMFNLIGFGSLYYRHTFRNQLNILLVSAFVLLWYNPLYLMDIGFLLSYFAMFGLLYFQPKWSLLWQPGNPVLQSVWQSVTASFAATVSTLPLTLFFFKQFALWFFVCNLLVVPVTFVLLFAAFLVLLKLPLITAIVNALVRFTLWFIQYFDHSGVGYVDFIDFRWWDMVFLAVLLLCFSIGLSNRSFRSICVGLCVLIVWQFISLFVSAGAKFSSGFIVYYNTKHSQIGLKNTREFYLNALQSHAFDGAVKPSLIAANYPLVISGPFNYVKAPNHCILILDQLGYAKGINKEVSTLVLSRQGQLSEALLKQFPNLTFLVAEASNNPYRMRKADELCRKFGIEFYDVKRRGAYVLNLNETQDRR
mgnify:CR=1 FL=1